MKNISMFLAFLLLASFAFVSCKKSDMSTSSALNYQIHVTKPSFDGSLTSAMPSGSGHGSYALTSVSRMGIYLEWDSAYMNISKIKFEAEKKENAQAKDTTDVLMEWKGPKSVNLWTVSPVLGSISLNPGYYDKIIIKVEADKSDAGSEPTFFIRGVYTNTLGSSVPIVFKMDDNVVIEAKKENFTINSSTDYTSLINLRLNLLLTDVKQADFNNATMTAGVLIISSTSNATLYNLFKNNLQSLSGELDFH